MSESSRPAGDGDEIVYELGDWTADERTDLEGRLRGGGISYRWEEEEDLVVAAADEQVVEALLDELEFPDQMEAADESEDVDDQAVYSVMSDLFVAADRLKDHPSDGDVATDFVSAADQAVAAPAPFGVAPEVWQQVQELAVGINGALANAADDDVVARDAGDLRQLLSRFV